MSKWQPMTQDIGFGVQLYCSKRACLLKVFGFTFTSPSALLRSAAFLPLRPCLPLSSIHTHSLFIAMVSFHRCLCFLMACCIPNTFRTSTPQGKVDVRHLHFCSLLSWTELQQKFVHNSSSQSGVYALYLEHHTARVHGHSGP